MTPLLFGLALSAVLVSSAAAGVQVRATVAPDTIPQCSDARFNAVLWNSGTDTLRAAASDGSADQVFLRFTVGGSDCPPPAVVNDPGLALMSGISTGLSLEPDSATPTLQHGWGQLKVRYRR